MQKKKKINERLKKQAYFILNFVELVCKTKDLRHELDNNSKRKFLAFLIKYSVKPLCLVKLVNGQELNNFKKPA